MFYMRELGIGKSSGAFRDDQQGENTAKILKTTLWLRGQGPCFCKQDFSHNLSTKSHSELIPCALPFCYNLHHFDSSCTNLPERSRETGRESRAIRQEKPVISRVWRGGVRGNKFMLRMWLLDIVVIFLVLWWSRGQTDDGAHQDDSSLFQLPQGWDVLRKLLYVKVIVRVPALLRFIFWSGYKMTEELDWIYSPPLNPVICFSACLIYCLLAFNKNIFFVNLEDASDG